jgi:hypothetical protein
MFVPRYIKKTHEYSLWAECRILGAFAKLRKVTQLSHICTCTSVWVNSAPTGQIFMKFNIWVPLENLWRKFKFYLYLTRITGTLHEEQ